MFGVNNQSARALAGPTTSSTAAINAHFFNIRSSWPSLHLSPWCDGVRGCGGASEVPTAPPQSSIEQLSPRQLCGSLVLSGGCAQMPDGDADDECPVDACVREKHFASRIHGFEEPLIEEIELRRCHAHATWIRAKANDCKRHRRESFEIGVRIDACRELLSETDVLREDGA